MYKLRAYTVKLILICDVNIKINLKFITCNINFVCGLKNYTSNASLQELGVLRLKNKLLKLSIELQKQKEGRWYPDFA